MPSLTIDSGYSIFESTGLGINLGRSVCGSRVI